MKTNLTTAVVLLCTFCTCCTGLSRAEPGAEDSSAREQRMRWWREARFGMFVHWGLYSGLAGEWDGKPVSESPNMEWIQHQAKVDTETYADRAIPLFQPKPGFADQWAQVAKQAGCRYVVFTTKHHEGFALHDSRVSDFDAGSILNRDLVREIVDACRAEGLRVGFYHSVIDWHHDQFAYAESESIPHPLRGKPYPNGNRDHQEYIKYLHAEAEELVTDYGPVDIMWWDFSVPDFQGDRAWKAFDLMAVVRMKQPNIIMNNRLFRNHEAGWIGSAGPNQSVPFDTKYGDFVTPEQHVPDTGMPGLDWETCMTMNNTWGYCKYDHDWKSTRQLIHTLIEIASKGGNFLLNVGPMGDGTVPAESVERLAAMGRWLAVNGEAIYGTSASPSPKPGWGRLTEKVDEGIVYLHVFDWPSDGQLKLTSLPLSVNKAILLNDEVDVPFTQVDGTLLFTLPANPPDPIASVIRLQCSRE